MVKGLSISELFKMSGVIGLRVDRCGDFGHGKGFEAQVWITPRSNTPVGMGDTPEMALRAAHDVATGAPRRVPDVEGGPEWKADHDYRTEWDEEATED